MAHISVKTGVSRIARKTATILSTKYQLRFPRFASFPCCIELRFFLLLLLGALAKNPPLVVLHFPYAPLSTATTYERVRFFVNPTCTRDTRFDIDERRWNRIRKYHRGKRKRDWSNIVGSSIWYNIVRKISHLCTAPHHLAFCSYATLSSELSATLDNVLSPLPVSFPVASFDQVGPWFITTPFIPLLITFDQFLTASHAIAHTNFNRTIFNV